MARTPLQVQMFFDRIHCNEEGDGIGSAEPYLWTVFFKVDGDTVFLGDDLFLHGTGTIGETPGSHGNLGDTDVDAGDDVAIPSAIGEFQTTLKPIPVSDWVRQTFNVDDVGGAVGAAVVLMEEDWVTDAGAEAGHVALNNFVRQAIVDLIPTLGVTNPEVTQEQIAALTANAPGAISDAVASAQGAWDNFASWLNGDDLLGTNVFTFGHDTLAADAFHDMHQRWVEIVVDQQGNQSIANDWEIFGKIQGIQPCPAAASVSLLKAGGVLTEEDAREAMAAANEFRQRTFAGDRGLGAWWALAERNTAAIAGVLHANPDVTRKFGGATVIELASALAGKTPLSDEFVTQASALLGLLADKGPRRLRIDAKAALGILPSLKGKTLPEALDTLRRRAPTRKPGRLPRDANKKTGSAGTRTI